ncbi:MULTISPECIES: hypothetical protein, partial [unclassified Methylobacterium]|uniref:hypothetical protein n=1 Tax=unclassified Methylobacterium TaxID=2615210 RepID=UPI00226ADA8D
PGTPISTWGWPYPGRIKMISPVFSKDKTTEHVRVMTHALRSGQQFNRFMGDDIGITKAIAVPIPSQKSITYCPGFDFSLRFSSV